MTAFSPEFRKGFASALYEYLLVTMPIGLYVFLEADTQGKWAVLYRSPEWSIATIFLAWISMLRYNAVIYSAEKRPAHSVVGTMNLVNLVIILFAVLNTRKALQAHIALTDLQSTAHPDDYLKARLILFGFATILFFILITGAHLLKGKNEQPK